MILKWIKNILISLDQLANTILGGDPDMTLSARLGRNYRGTWIERLVDWMFAWQKRPGGHCENSDWWEQDEGKDAVLK